MTALALDVFLLWTRVNLTKQKWPQVTSMKKKISKEKTPVLIILKALLLTNHLVTCVEIREGLISRWHLSRELREWPMWLFGKISRLRDLCAQALRQEVSRSVQSHVAGEEQGKERRIGQVCMCTVLYSPIVLWWKGPVQAWSRAMSWLRFREWSEVGWRQSRQLKYWVPRGDGSQARVVQGMNPGWREWIKTWKVVLGGFAEDWERQECIWDFAWATAVVFYQDKEDWGSFDYQFYCEETIIIINSSSNNSSSNILADLLLFVDILFLPLCSLTF